MSRYYSNWIEGFLEYSKDFPSPQIYKRWAAISGIAAALQRKCYTRIAQHNQYPNLYVLLIGPPGSGKTVAIRAVRSICKEHAGIKLTPNKITGSAFYDQIEAAVQVQQTIQNGKAKIHSSLTGMIDEFSVFVKSGDLDFMATLADVFDCPDPLEYVTRTSGSNYAQASWFNLIAGSTPYTLKETFSNEAIEMGFPARIILIHAGEPVHLDNIFDEDAAKKEQKENKEYKKLTADLESILQMEGLFTWTPEAQHFLEEWYKDKLRPYPEDPRLQHYCTRRLTHISKLAMVHSAAMREDMIIDLEVLKKTQETLLAAERVMPRATEALGENKYQAIEKACLVVVGVESKRRGGKPVPEHIIRSQLARDVPPYMIDQMLDGLISRKLLKAVGVRIKPTRDFLLVSADERK